jgi:hypothetical protein
VFTSQTRGDVLRVGDQHEFATSGQESRGCGDLGLHAARGELAGREVVQSLGHSQLVHRSLLRGAEVEKDLGDAGDQHKRRGTERAREYRGGEILVDDAVDGQQLIAPANHRDTAPTCCHRDDTGGSKTPNDRCLDDLARARRGHHPTPAAAGVLCHHPTPLLGERCRLFAVEERPSGLGRPTKCRIVGVDDDMRDHRCDGCQSRGPQGQHQQAAELALRHRHECRQWQRWNEFHTCLLLQGEVADLWPVAMGHHDRGTGADNSSHCPGDALSVRALLVRAASLTGGNQRVAAQGHDQGHAASVTDSRRHVEDSVRRQM